MAAILGIVLYVFYKTAFHGSKYQATPGKILIGIKVVGADGNRITYTHSFMRSCAELISELILFIGYVIAAFSVRKQSLHDKICTTYVANADALKFMQKQQNP